MGPHAPKNAMLWHLRAVLYALHIPLISLAAVVTLALRVYRMGDECSPVSMGSHATMNAMLWHLETVLHARTTFD